MEYCFVDSTKATSNLYSLISSKGLISIPVFYIEYTNFELAKQSLKKIENSLEQYTSFSHLAVHLNIQKIDQQLQQFVSSLKQKFSIVMAQGGLNKINRFLLESTQIDLLIDPHSSKDKIKTDFIHHFNSGINHILSTFAKEKSTTFMINLNSFYQKKKNLSKDIGRIEQNIRFCRKYGIPIICGYIVSKPSQIKSIVELSSILHLLGGSKEQILISSKQVSYILQTNDYLRSSHTLCKGMHYK